MTLTTNTKVKIALLALVAPALLVIALLRWRERPGVALPNRLPEAAPYLTAEARAFPPPYEDLWRSDNHSGQCKNCHPRIFEEWSGSMMSNAWRDPIWRAAFLLLARSVSTHGECDTPDPPDGTPRARLNPFAVPGECASRFDLGTRTYTVSRPGSLLDGFCSRCHMPTNYIDNVPLHTISTDPTTGLESAPLDPRFNPTSDNGTGVAFATVEAQLRNTESGKAGITCAVCHSYVETRDTPFHNHPRAAQSPVAGAGDLFEVTDPDRPHLGYAIGAGSFRLSPRALSIGERVGPLAAAAGAETEEDVNTSTVFGVPVPFQRLDQGKHRGFHRAMFVRSEMCAACHDVTNALPIKNQLGKWVGGFPIERTYTEWLTSRYADRPGNRNFDPRFKRDCQSCHMQQDYGQPGTAQTLYDQHGKPLPPAMGPVAVDGRTRPYFTHHFVGGNALVPRLIGKSVDATGNVAPYPELSVFSFSSADKHSPYSRAFYTYPERKGPHAQQTRLAWDRLRHVLTLDVDGPATVAAGATVPLRIRVANTGSGHNFPTGFPEGRNAWLAVHAHDLATGQELPIRDRQWKRTSPNGVGNLTTEEAIDPAFPGCKWKLPVGSPDPFSIQFKAVASLGDGCPTLALPYAAPLNMVVDRKGLPVDGNGRVIDADTNPRGLPQFTDRDGDGDLYDDAYLVDTRLRPLPNRDATLTTDRYEVVVPAGTRGPIAVSATVYYQSVEAMVAEKFLGNLADTNGNFVLEPCAAGGRCDGRRPSTEPPVVEGAPPVPMVVRNRVVTVEGTPADLAAPRVAIYPPAGAAQVFEDVVPKVAFSEPVRPLAPGAFTLSDARGAPVAARAGQIGDGVWGLFPDHLLLRRGERYTARLAGAQVCDLAGNCATGELRWTFTIAADPERAAGDTSIPSGFSGHWVDEPRADRTFSSVLR
jgi:hypothetical protein